MSFAGCEIHVFENDNYLTLIALHIRIALCFRKWFHCRSNIRKVMFLSERKPRIIKTLVITIYNGDNKEISYNDIQWRLGKYSIYLRLNIVKRWMRSGYAKSWYSLDSKQSSVLLADVMSVWYITRRLPKNSVGLILLGQNSNDQLTPYKAIELFIRSHCFMIFHDWYNKVPVSSRLIPRQNKSSEIKSNIPSSKYLSIPWQCYHIISWTQDQVYSIFFSLQLTKLFSKEVSTFVAEVVMT